MWFFIAYITHQKLPLLINNPYKPCHKRHCKRAALNQTHIRHIVNHLIASGKSGDWRISIQIYVLCNFIIETDIHRKCTLLYTIYITYSTIYGLKKQRTTALSGRSNTLYIYIYVLGIRGAQDAHNTGRYIWSWSDRELMITANRFWSRIIRARRVLSRIELLSVAP